MHKDHAPLADVFAVWGKPPEFIFTRLTEKQIAALKKYVDHVTSSAYRAGRDNGYEDGLRVAEAMIVRKRERGKIRASETKLMMTAEARSKERLKTWLRDPEVRASLSD